MNHSLQICDSQSGEERDFHFEMQKYSMHLRADFVARQAAIYELYKMTLDLPGSIVELGVRNGATFYYLARLLEIFGPASRKNPVYADRHLFGFDTFSGFTEIADQDKSSGNWPEMRVGGVSTYNKQQFLADFARFQQQSPEGSRLHIIEGDVCETVPRFVRERPGTVIALLYFDLDVYRPTLTCLEHLYSLVPAGGLVVFDEYGYAEFPGETTAVNEFFQGKNVRFRRFPWAYCPSAYLVK
jgi:hypothetical protein